MIYRFSCIALDRRISFTILQRDCENAHFCQTYNSPTQKQDSLVLWDFSLGPTSTAIEPRKSSLHMIGMDNLEGFFQLKLFHGSMVSKAQTLTYSSHTRAFNYGGQGSSPPLIFIRSPALFLHASLLPAHLLVCGALQHRQHFPQAGCGQEPAAGEDPYDEERLRFGPEQKTILSFYLSDDIPQYHQDN